MCRLFGLRAAEPQRVHRALLQGPNALAKQSTKHPDGWGLAYVQDGALAVERALDAAHQSRQFATLTRDLRAPVVLAHVRKASVGDTSLPNTHPFVHDGWAFAHNGTVQGFAQRRRAFERAIDPALRRNLRGETDSERCFFLFLTRLGQQRGGLLERAARALAQTAVFASTGDPPDAPKPTSATFLCTNGDLLLALRLRRELSFSTHRSRTRPLTRTGGRIDQLVVASEPTDAQERWRRIGEGQGVATDGRLRLHRFQLSDA